ncbi:MAG: YcxB family protein [Methylotenera sp.]
MSLQTTLIYNESLIKKAVLSFWWRVVGAKYLLAVALVTFGLVYGYSVGDKSWLMGIYATILFFSITFIVALYLIHYRSSIQKFKAMGSPQATFTLTKDSFSLASGAGSATLPWSSVTEVWQFPEYWLFFFSKSQFSTLPVANLSPDIQAFIIERINYAGGKIG